MDFTTLPLYPRRESRYPLEGVVGPQGGSRRFGEEKNFFPLQGFEPQSSSPQASHHTDYAVLCIGYTYVLPTIKHYSFPVLWTVSTHFLNSSLHSSCCISNYKDCPKQVITFYDLYTNCARKEYLWRLSWFGHVQRMPDTRTVKKIFNWKPLTKRS